jgi:hypothetical protein
MIRAVLAAALLPLAAAASDDPLAGRVAGPPERCIPVSTTNGPNVIDARTILYTRGTSGGIVYRSTIESCPALRPLTTLIVDVYGGQVCRNDRFRVLEPGLSIPSAYCRFGDFVPYRKVKGRSD